MEYFHKKNIKNKFLDELTKRLSNADKIKIICGFATDKGLRQFIDKIGIKTFEDKVEYFLVGLLTPDSAEAFQNLYHFFTRKNIFYHGTKLICSKKATPNNKGSPMIHAKLILGEKDGNVKWACIGSANFTDFALNDINYEGSIFIDSDSSNSAILADIKLYMDSMKNQHSMIFNPSIRLPRFIPTGDGEFTFKLDSPFKDVGTLYLAIVLSNLKEYDFGKSDKDLIESDLLRDLRFTKHMEKIHQPILFLFAESTNFLNRGNFFIKMGSIVMSNDSIGGRKINTSATLGYINHLDHFPFIFLKARPHIVDPSKTSQALFRIYNSFREISQEIEMDSNTKYFIEKYIFNSNYKFKIINNIFTKQKYYHKYDVIEDKISSEENDNNFTIVDVNKIVEADKEIETFGNVYSHILAETIINYDELIGDLINQNDMSKENMDNYLKQNIDYRQNDLQNVPWTLKFNKILWTNID